MRATQGHGNSSGPRTTILALDILYKHGKPIDRNDKRSGAFGATTPLNLLRKGKAK
jgi:hypothetical protein